MQKLIIILVLFATSLVNAQGNYEQGMQKAFELWGSNKIVEASNLFERIAAAEPDNWLPSYYAAQINILKSFGETNEETITANLNKAQDLINDATAISKNNSEILVLQALLDTAWVAYDGATYGPTLAGKVASTYARAEQIDPTNPRVVFGKAEWGMGSARYFGQDIKPFCKDIERSIELFANFKPETSFHPNWGKERAEQVFAETCKE
ncbi:hypothetical protein RXV94_10060 [Yeosuana sp. MJ-SS3]|uniref:Tetratricopeptide repeat protein n=1 Tax=Gilvirhabdus luticola TaxID=3079858 RepID=A0ABU3U7X1_9FLAO|nr:hypothetical protein [Yeosuana sp. MJ-SS3]MDU8886504.1 hypothetical protein [Yeosuana sp. MJ-SS3]